jgi:hypothetical protein
MKYTTVKIGHFEVNYGDQHYRRTDNGQGIYNAFVGNSILEAFTTEVGGEVVFQRAGFLAVGAITNGEIRGQLARPADRDPAHMLKVGFDRQINEDLRVRLTGSWRGQKSAVSNTLFSGDRAGSRYYYVLENFRASESAQFTSGAVNPGFSDKMTAMVINPFVKFHGFEFFALRDASGRRRARRFAYDAHEGKRSTASCRREGVPGAAWQFTGTRHHRCATLRQLDVSVKRMNRQGFPHRTCSSRRSATRLRRFRSPRHPQRGNFKGFMLSRDRVVSATDGPVDGRRAG